MFVNKVGKIKTANPNDGCSIAADPDKIIMGIANPTMPFTKPATKHTATKNKIVDVSTWRITFIIEY